MFKAEFLKIFFQILLVFFHEGAYSLRLVKVVVPPYKLRGDNAILECHYELDGATLYAVKWYKENEEFYKYVAKYNPPQHSYKVDGIKVDLQMSNSRQVMLKGVGHNSSGVYRCEVSGEGPSFQSAQKEGRMDVVFLPRDGPHISGEKKEYQIGDVINLNCSSGKSHPPSRLRWFINDKEAKKSDLFEYPNQVQAHGLITTHLGLRTILSLDHFIDGNLKVRCVATLSPQLWQNDRESILQKIDNREAMLLVKSISSITKFNGILIFWSQVLIIIVLWWRCRI